MIDIRALYEQDANKSRAWGHVYQVPGPNYCGEVLDTRLPFPVGVVLTTKLWWSTSWKLPIEVY